MALTKKKVTTVTKVVLPKKVKEVIHLPTYYYETDSDSIIIYDCEEDDSEIFRAYILLLPYCCGVLEIGDLDIESQHIAKEKNFQTIIDLAIIKLLTQETTSAGIHTFVANLVNNAACNALRDSFKRTGLFTCVKTFMNYSGSTIDMWISRN